METKIQALEAEVATLKAQLNELQSKTTTPKMSPEAIKAFSEKFGNFSQLMANKGNGQRTGKPIDKEKLNEILARYKKMREERAAKTTTAAPENVEEAQIVEPSAE